MGRRSAILVLGLGVFARHVHRISQDRNVRIASTLGAAIAAVGALAWIIRCYNGAVLPPDELLNNPSRWLDILFMAYSILTQIALIITGFVLLRSGYPKWLGWVVLVFGGLLLVMWILLGGGPPGLNNIPLLVMGIVLLRLRSRSPQSSFEPA